MSVGQTRDLNLELSRHKSSKKESWAIQGMWLVQKMLLRVVCGFLLQTTEG